VKIKSPVEKNFRRAKAVKPVRKRATRRFISWRSVVTCAAVPLGLYATYRTFDLVLHASVLQVRRIVVRGHVQVSTGEVRALLDGLRGTSILTADLPQYRARLMASPWVGEAALRRRLPSTIEVFVSERRPIGLCRIGSHLYLVDRSGTIIEEYGPQYAKLNLPIIDGALRTPPSRTPLIDERRTELAARVIDSLAASQQLSARLSQIDVSDLLDAVVLIDGDPALLHLGDERFAERLQAYLDLAPTLRETAPEIDYVDLRFGDRIYIRPAGSGARQTAVEPAARR
jgi:cell division septal protein FtsQ